MIGHRTLVTVLAVPIVTVLAIPALLSVSRTETSPDQQALRPGSYAYVFDRGVIQQTGTPDTPPRTSVIDLAKNSLATEA